MLHDGYQSLNTRQSVQLATPQPMPTFARAIRTSSVVPDATTQLTSGTISSSGTSRCRIQTGKLSQPQLAGSYLLLAHGVM